MPEQLQNYKDKKIVPDDIGKELNDFRFWMQHKRYSGTTIKTYLDGAKSLIKFMYLKPIQEADKNDMVRYANEYIIANRLNYSYQT